MFPPVYTESLLLLLRNTMTDIIVFLNNNSRASLYTGGNIHELYRYLEMIGSPKTLTTSGQRSHHFGPSSNINNDAASLYTVIIALLMIQKSIWECCGSIVNKVDSCIICGPNFLCTSIRRHMHMFNALNGEEPN